jgi:hypothetical protein
MNRMLGRKDGVDDLQWQTLRRCACSLKANRSSLAV